MADTKISALTSATTPLAGTEVLPIVQSGTTKKVAVADLTAGRSVAASQVVIGGGSAVQNLTINGNGNMYATAGATWYTGGDLYIRAGASGALRLGANNNNDLAILSTAGNFTNYYGNYIPNAAGKGINFTANTGAAGMTSQLLNWYEEGTWNGGVSFGGASTGITYNNYVGYYTRIGNIVTVSNYINLSNKGSSTGAARITGLPFTCANNASAYAAAALFFSNLTYTGQVGNYVNINNTTIDLFQTTEAGTATALTDANFANNTAFIINLSYRAA
jgi:hypothetical protein